MAPKKCTGMPPKGKRSRQPTKISRYFFRKTANRDFVSPHTDSMSSTNTVVSTAESKQDNDQPMSIATQAIAQDSTMAGMEGRLMLAIQNLDSKLDKKVQELKEDFCVRLDKISKTLDGNCQKVADLEASLNFAHTDITDLKTTITQAEKTNRQLQESMSVSEKKVVSLEKELEETKEQMSVHMNHLERRSRDYNIRVRNATIRDNVNYVDQVATVIVQHQLAPEGSSVEDVAKEIEIAHPLKTKGQMIARFYSRPYRNRVVQQAKQKLNRTTPKDGLKVVEDLTRLDFEQKMKAMPLMKKAFEEGKKSRFHKGNLIIEGKLVAIPQD